MTDAWGWIPKARYQSSQGEMQGRVKSRSQINRKIDMEKSVNEIEKSEKKQGKLRKEHRKIDTEKSVNLQSESIALANSSLVNLLKEKLASSKKSDSMPQVHSMVYKKCSFLNEYFIIVEIFMIFHFTCR